MRQRLFLWIGLLLGSLVFLLPFFIEHDGSAQMYARLFITYSMGVCSVFLTLLVLWLSCSSIAQEFEECRIQMLFAKPVAAWQVWVGKWLGIMFISFVFLSFSGIAIYGALQWHARGLAPSESDAMRREVMVAREAVGEDFSGVESEVDRIYKERIRGQRDTQFDREFVRRKTEDFVKAKWEVIPAKHVRTWSLNLNRPAVELQKETLRIRLRFHAGGPDTSKNYVGVWKVGPPNSGNVWYHQTELVADAFHEFELPDGLVNDSGRIDIEFRNFSDTTLLFPLKDGLKILYPAGSFAGNLARALGIVFCFNALVAALGLAASGAFSFSVAAFLVTGMLIVFSSGNIISSVVTEGTIGGLDHETGEKAFTTMDWLLVPFFKGVSKLSGLFDRFSPIQSLATGRNIGFQNLLHAFLLLVIGFGCLFGCIGVLLLRLREPARIQNHS